MSSRSYDQYCPVAWTLDIIGERWALLIVRDLLTGPKRYTDLSRGLPGLSPTLLAARLAHLERTGIVHQRQLPPPAARAVYELTDEGRTLAPIVSEFARWGMSRLPEPDAQHEPTPVMAVRAALLAYAQPDFREATGCTYQLVIDDETFTVQVDTCSIDLGHGGSTRADLTITATARDLILLRRGALTPSEAREQDRLTFEPSEARRIERFLKLFRLPPTTLPEGKPKVRRGGDTVAARDV